MSQAQALLCIDAGNTLVKWCVHGNFTQAFSSANELFSHPTAGLKPLSGSLNTLREQLGPFMSVASNPVGCVLLSNVLGPELEQVVRQLCGEYGVPLHVLGVNTRQQVQSLYQNPLSLGKDRWAACLAVAQLSDVAVNVVLSFGTATTLDVLVKTSSWQHLGGFIVPGVQTMLSSLHSNTVELPQVELGKAHEVSGWPVNTQHAIAAGVGRMQIALVQSVVAQLETTYSEAPDVWFSGGFAQQMQLHLPSARLLENAVFRGLVFDYQLARQGKA